MGSDYKQPSPAQWLMLALSGLSQLKNQVGSVKAAVFIDSLNRALPILRELLASDPVAVAALASNPELAEILSSFDTHLDILASIRKEAVDTLSAQDRKRAFPFVAAFDDLLDIVEVSIVTCDGHGDTGVRIRGGEVLGCFNLPTKEVAWSDRTMYVCDQHVDYARHCAAYDGSGDRTDDPRINDFSQDPMISKHWLGAGLSRAMARSGVQEVRGAPEEKPDAPA